MAAAAPSADRLSRLGTEATLASTASGPNANKRTSGRSSGQPAAQVGKPYLSEGSARPNSTGTQPRPPSVQQQDVQIRPEEDHGYLMRSHQHVHNGQVGVSRDVALRTSKDGTRPVSRPGSQVAQSPYLQSPGGRASQGLNHRPTSRQQTQQPPQHTVQPQGGPPPAASSAANHVAQRGSVGSNSVSVTSSLSNGARIFQMYGAPPPRSLQPVAAPGPTLHAHAKQPQPQPSMPGSQVRQSMDQQQQARVAAVQQQQQQAGPRATTALSGARSMQRARHDSGSGSSDTVPSALQAGLRSVAGTGAGSAAANHSSLFHTVQHGAGGGGGGREADNSASFGYDDIPEEDDESASPVVSNAFSGLTLDQYMQRMVTTPASAAATSGLGVSADSEESAPCSPGNASTRTEEEDSLYNSPGVGGPTSPALSRGGADGDSDRLAGSGGRGAVSGGSASGGRASLTGQSPPTSLKPRLGSTTAPSGLGSSGRGFTAQTVRGQVDGGGQRGGGGVGAVSVALPGGGAGAGGGARSSGTNQLLCRGPMATGGLIGRGAAATGSGVHEDVHLGGCGGDISGLRDGDSSDDENDNPSTLLKSPRNARHLTSRASAMAFSNSLDLRPATAAVVSSPSMTRGDPNTGRGMAMSLAADPSSHHAIIKQVDLGGLSASLFTPNPTSGASPVTSATNISGGGCGNDHLLGSNPSSPDLPAAAAGRSDRRPAAAPPSILRLTGSGGATDLVVGSPSPLGGALVSGVGVGGSVAKALISPKSPMTAIPPPWGVSAREGAFGAGSCGDGAGGAGSLQALASRPLSSRGRPAALATGSSSAVDAGGLPSPAATGANAGAAGGRPGSGSKWANKQQLAQQKPLDGGPVELPPEAQLIAAEAQGIARPPTRQVQSARPPGSRGEVELDPSVWQANIAMQLQRPPSRQKPPPEALHLWTPEQQMSMLASGGLGRPGGSGRPLGGRPQSAAPTTYRGTRPTSGPSVRAQGPVGEDMAGTVARPPSRQKPPPLSTLLEHDDFPPPPAGARRPRPGADQLDVVVSGSEDDDDDLDL